MAAAARGLYERLRRAARTAFFLAAMAASLLAASAPALVAAGDVAVAVTVAVTVTGGVGGRRIATGYGFTSSLLDVPLLSVLRSLVITCFYCLGDCSSLAHGRYLGIVVGCSAASVVILAIKACVYSPVAQSDAYVGSPSMSEHKLHKPLWGMPILFISSAVFALGHIVVAYRTSYKARRKLMLQRADPELILAYKSIFSGYQKNSRSPSRGKYYSKSDSMPRRKAFAREQDVPASFLAESDSLFIACQGIFVHYKIYEPSHLNSLASTLSLKASQSAHQSGTSAVKSPPESAPVVRHQLSRSFSSHYNNASLYDPLLVECGTSPSSPSQDSHLLDHVVSSSALCAIDLYDFDSKVPGDKFAVVLIHGFGGGVFSWRNVSNLLAMEVGCTVVAFDRPGWGLTTRLRRKEWQDKQLSNPYKLESQVDLLISFCLEMGFSSVVFVGHDDGGLLALKAAEKLRASTIAVDVKGVVLINVSLSREVVPAFARILLHTSLGKKHMVRSLLRTEIAQVINRHAWYDATKLTTEVLNLYKAPLFVEGWEEALHEIGRLSFATVLSPQNAAALLKSAEDLPVLVVAGVEDALISLKSAQSMACKLRNSRLITISGCGHLPHEECPAALLSALSPFISRLLCQDHSLQGQ